MTTLLQELSQPFPPENLTWKPGKLTNDGGRCLAMPYADVRAYQDRLDQVCGLDWSVRYEPWGNERIIAVLTIGGVTRSSTGEMDGQDQKNGLGGTASEAQAFKRACSMFGLGRYLYDLPNKWADFDKEKKRFSDNGLAQLDAFYRGWYKQALAAASNRPAPAPATTTPEESFEEEPQREESGQPSKKQLDTITPAQKRRLHALGGKLYGKSWDVERKRLVETVSKGAITSSDDLTVKEAEVLITGMERKLHEQAQAAQQERVAA